MRDLIARLEAATGPDRDLDFAIAAAVGWPDSPHSHQHARRYTEHLDAARSLVPEGWDWSVDGFGKSARGRGYLYSPYPDCEEVEAEAATPAIALCIAALRAREAAHA